MGPTTGSGCRCGRSQGALSLPDPDNETEEDCKAVFVAELDNWHRDTAAWPAERTYPVFRKWFEVRCYPLIQARVGEELIAERRPAADPAGGAATVAGLLLLAQQGGGEHG